MVSYVILYENSSHWKETFQHHLNNWFENEAAGSSATSVSISL